MSEPFLSEIKICAFNFAPKGWASCNGQLMPINQNQALFSLLGTTYGGDGRTNFSLPNLQGRVPTHMGNGHVLGERGGEENHTLILNELPQHTHALGVNSGTANKNSPVNNVLATASANIYESPGAAVPMGQGGGGPIPLTISNVGGSQPHTNLQPYLVLSFCIALQGIFPSRN